jgi:hypothetical protein
MFRSRCGNQEGRARRPANPRPLLENTIAVSGPEPEDSCRWLLLVRELEGQIRAGTLGDGGSVGKSQGGFGL